MIDQITFEELATQIVNKYSDDHEKMRRAMLYLNMLINAKNMDEYNTILNLALSEFLEIFRSLGGVM